MNRMRVLDRMNRNKYMHGIMKYSDVCRLSGDYVMM